MLVRGAIGLLLADDSDERVGAAGSSGSSCGGGAGKGPGVSCARASLGIASPLTARKQTKPTIIVTLLLIIILTRAVLNAVCAGHRELPSHKPIFAAHFSSHRNACAHLIVSYFSMRETTCKMSTQTAVRAGSVSG
jgi:hypothetical protein